MNEHEEERSHCARVNRLLHIAFVFAESPLQQPTSAVVVGVEVVVISQSL